MTDPSPWVPPSAEAQLRYESLLAAPRIYALLKADRVLVVLGAWQTVAMAAVVTAVLLPAVWLGEELSRVHFGAGYLAVMALAGWCAWWPSTLACGAVALAVAARADERPISSGEALTQAWARRRQLARWLLTASIQGPTNGFHDRYGAFEVTTRSTRGLGWGIGASLSVPIMMMEGATAPQAIDRSVRLLSDRLGVNARSHIRAFTYWSYVALLLGVVSGAGWALVLHEARTTSALSGLAVTSTVLATVAGISAFVAVSVRSAATTVLNTLTYRKALGRSTLGVSPTVLPGHRKGPMTH
jgi:hypothetical protein